MCVMAVVGEAPRQCFSAGRIQTTSPGRISSVRPPQRFTRPQPAVTIKVWPTGCVCHAVRAPGSAISQADFIPQDPFEADSYRSEEHTSELQSQSNLVCR